MTTPWTGRVHLVSRHSERMTACGLTSPGLKYRPRVTFAAEIVTCRACRSTVAFRQHTTVFELW